MASSGDEGKQALLKFDSDDEGAKEEKDDMLLHPGLYRPPYKASAAKTIMEEWKSSSGTGSRKRSRNSLKSRASSGLPCAQSRSGICVLTMCLVITVIVAAVLGYVVGLFVGQSLGQRSRAVEGGGGAECSTAKTPPYLRKAESYDWGEKVVIDGIKYDVPEVFSSELNTSVIRASLFNFTSLPHIAGGDTNRDLAFRIYNEFYRYGFDTVEFLNYTVLLSYPDKDNPNSLRLMDSGGSVVYESKIAQEPPLTDDEKKDNVAAPFNAYSGNGNVMGPLVYVNFGTIDDFLYLTNGTVLQLNLSKYICIARYGKIFRGDKARLAESYGCRGLLIYSDPQYDAPKDVPVYPYGPSLPEFGVQRGTVLVTNGDPLTPGIPAIPGMYRRPYADVLSEHAAPTIPVQPVSYGDIINFMSQLSDYTPPDSWVGGLDLNYRIAQSTDNDNVTELVVNVYQISKDIHNVVAKLYGSVEPDRHVVLGNHRDAWVFGAADPNSGTAVLMGLARVIGYLRANNWRPGRTLFLCSWDAEEYGLLGSTEWVEDFGKLLGASTVAYLNVDVAVSGSLYAHTSANPLLYEPVWKAAKAVQSPNPDHSTLYDEWLSVSPKDYNGVIKPKIGNLGSGSDFTMFIQTQGISCTGMNYGNKTGSYAVYHSVHDNFYWMTNFGDPTFTHHRALGLMWVNTALSLLTSPVLPGKATDYGFIVEEIFSDLNQQYGEILNKNRVLLDYLSVAVSNFVTACREYETERDNLISSMPDISDRLNLLRIVNNKLMNVERAFIHPEGLPGRPYYKHVIFAPSSVNSYASSLFPGISDSIFNAMHSGGSWNQVKQQIDIVRMHLRHATQILREPSLQYAPKG